MRCECLTFSDLLLGVVFDAGRFRFALSPPSDHVPLLHGAGELGQGEDLHVLPRRA